MKLAHNVRRIPVNGELLLMDEMGSVVRLNSTAATTLDNLLAGEESARTVADLMMQTGGELTDVEAAVHSLLRGLTERGFIDVEER